MIATAGCGGLISYKIC